MNSTAIIFCICLLGTSLVGHSQSLKDRSTIGREMAKNELQLALKDTLRPVVSSGKLLIPTSSVAIQIAEPILFQIYGKKQIVSERPYESYLIGHCWIILGTLPKDSDGGTFQIVVDARNSKVIQVTHGK